MNNEETWFHLFHLSMNFTQENKTGVPIMLFFVSTFVFVCYSIELRFILLFCFHSPSSGAGRWLLGQSIDGCRCQASTASAAQRGWLLATDARFAEALVQIFHQHILNVLALFLLAIILVQDKNGPSRKITLHSKVIGAAKTLFAKSLLTISVVIFWN